VHNESDSESDSELDRLIRGWAELIRQFTDEVGRIPSGSELAEVLTWALRSFVDQVEGFPPDAVVEVVRGRSSGGGAGQSKSEKRARKIAFEVDQLNDSVFVIAADLVSGAVAASARVVGRPSAQVVLNLLHDGLEQARASKVVELPDDSVGHWKIRASRKKAQIRTRVGDIVAVPVGRGNYRHVIVVAKNDFGTAVGILDGPGPLHPTAPLRPTGLRPVYVGEESIGDGSWPIVGHDEEPLEHFDQDPEIFHDNDPNLPDPMIGPFGSGETASGRMRKLTEAEANEIGLLDESYRQFLLPQQLEDYLKSH
jgi:hypothetical protein